MKSLPALIIAAAFLTHWTSRAVAVTTVSNLGVSYPHDPLPIYINGSALPFTTGPLASQLNTITVSLEATNGPVSCQAELWSDAGGMPGTIIETFSPQTAPTVAPVQLTFTSTALDLASNTTYWFYISGDLGVEWLISAPGGETSAYGWSIGNADMNYEPALNPSWIQSPWPPTQIQIDVTFIPEPSTLAACAMILLPLTRRHRKQPCRRTAFTTVT